MNVFTDHGDTGYKMDAHGNGGGSKSAHGDTGGHH